MEPTDFEGYELRGVLGVGGFGTVYEAWDPAHDRRVALKIYNMVLDEGGARAFRKERRASGRLSEHPSVVNIFHSGISDDRRGYLVLEYIDGGTLQDYIESHGPPEAGDLLGWSLQLAEALTFAHANGVWHRDIKPANVLLKNGRALLADFGIARVVTATSSSSIAGESAIYAAPERVIDHRDGPEGDIYSFGMMLWVASTGDFPLGLSATDPPAQAANTARSSPSPVLPSGVVSAKFGLLVTHMLEPDPRRRLSSAQAVLAGLRQCQQVSGRSPIGAGETQPGPKPSVAVRQHIDIAISATGAASKDVDRLLKSLRRRERQLGTSDTQRVHSSLSPALGDDSKTVFEECGTLVVFLTQDWGVPGSSDELALDAAINRIGEASRVDRHTNRPNSGDVVVVHKSAVSSWRSGSRPGDAQARGLFDRQQQVISAFAGFDYKRGPDALAERVLTGRDRSGAGHRERWQFGVKAASITALLVVGASIVVSAVDWPWPSEPVVTTVKDPSATTSGQTTSSVASTKVVAERPSLQILGRTGLGLDIELEGVGPKGLILVADKTGGVATMQVAQQSLEGGRVRVPNKFLTKGNGSDYCLLAVRDGAVNSSDARSDVVCTPGVTDPSPFGLDDITSG